MVWARGLLQEITEAARPERGDRLRRGTFLFGLLGLGAAGDRRPEEVQMDADQPLGRLPAHSVGDASTLVAALGHVAGVPETPH